MESISAVTPGRDVMRRTHEGLNTRFMGVCYTRRYIRNRSNVYTYLKTISRFLVRLKIINPKDREYNNIKEILFRNVTIYIYIYTRV